MLELMLCSMLTLLPDYLFRRYVQGRRIGHEITIFSVWYELRYGITLCLILTVLLITVVLVQPSGVGKRHLAVPDYLDISRDWWSGIGGLRRL